MTYQYWDKHILKRPMSKEKRRYQRLCDTLNHERRDPRPYEWDIIIDYMYPEEDRILDRLDKKY